MGNTIYLEKSVSVVTIVGAVLIEIIRLGKGLLLSGQAFCLGCYFFISGMFFRDLDEDISAWPWLTSDAAVINFAAD